MTTTFDGSCHCGQTTWTAQLEKKQQGHVLCHCRACKALSGGAATANVIIPKSQFTLTKGELKKYTYAGDSGNQVDCFYCPNCTSHPYHHQHVLGPDTIVLRTGLLKSAASLKPLSEIYGSDKWSWEPELAETFEFGPPS